MAGAGYKLFNTGDVLTAAQVNTYLQEQTVMVFASSTARTTALSGVLAEGMVSYLQDTNAVEVYNGSAWVGVSGAGDVTEVQAGTGISVASGTGPIPVVTNTMATAVDAKGDLIVGTGADTFARLAVGTNGHTLVADSSTATGLAYAAPSAGLTWAAGGNGNLPAASSLQLSISSKESVIIRISGMSTTADAAFYLRINNSSASVYDYNGFSHTTNTTATTNYIKQINDSKFELNYPNGLDSTNNEGTWYIRVDGCKNGGFVSMYTTGLLKNVGSNNLAISFGGMFQTSGAVTTLDLILSAGNFDAGTYEYWVA
jgi:hypothetical protein